MASAKQIAWRKKFARMSKAGKFRKTKRKTIATMSSLPHSQHLGKKPFSQLTEKQQLKRIKQKGIRDLREMKSTSPQRKRKELKAKKDFEAWLKANPQHAESYREFQREY